MQKQHFQDVKVSWQSSYYLKKPQEYYILMPLKELFLINSQVRQQLITQHLTFQRKLSNKQMLVTVLLSFSSTKRIWEEALLVNPITHESITDTQKVNRGQKMLHRYVLILFHWLTVPSSD